MNEEEKAIEYFKESFGKTLPPFWYDDTIANNEEQIKILLNLINKLQKELQEEKEKNKKLEEVAHNLAQAIRFMSTNEKLTVEDIIKEFTENQITEEFMQRWEKSQHEESYLKDKVIDMMAEELSSLKAAYDFNCFIPDKYSNIDDCINKADKNISCSQFIKEYYFNKVKEKQDEE